MAAIVTKIGWVDLVGLILIIWGFIAGVKRGLEGELPRFFEIAAATLITFRYYQNLGNLLHAQLSLPKSATDFFSFLLIALACVVTLRIVFKVLGTIVSFQFMAPISRLGGAFVGGLRFVLIFSLLSYFLLMLPLDFFKSSFTFERSWSGPFFAQTSEKFYRLVTYYMPVKLDKISGIRPAGQS